MAFGWKGGIGTSSRRVPGRPGEPDYTIGVLVQSNFGGSLTIAGVPVWRELTPPRERTQSEDGSCMIVVATDAPLDARQLARLAARAILGMARTGSSGSHGSGDYVIAFSTTNRALHRADSAPAAALPPAGDDRLSRMFAAVIEATEEAIYNSLLRATTVRGRDGHVAEAIPIARLREILKRSGP